MSVSERQYFEIAVGTGTPGNMVATGRKYKVLGETTATPGLVVTCGEGIDYAGPYWKVTHMASGYAATCAMPKEVARMVAGAMGGLLDWTMSDRLAINRAVRGLDPEWQSWLKNNLIERNVNANK